MVTGYSITRHSALTAVLYKHTATVTNGVVKKHHIPSEAFCSSSDVDVQNWIKNKKEELKLVEVHA